MDGKTPGTRFFPEEPSIRSVCLITNMSGICGRVAAMRREAYVESGDGDEQTRSLRARFRGVLRALRSRLPRLARPGLRGAARPLELRPMLDLCDTPREPLTLRLCPQLLLVPRRRYPRRRQIRRSGI
jgi:hypothetical protein